MGVGRPFLASLAAVAALLWAAPPASAQEASSVSLGVGVSVTTPTNDAAGTDVGPGVVIRLSGSDGFGPTIGLSWFTTPLHTDVDGERVELGNVSVRPLMFGVGYTREISRRLSWHASLAAGIAFANARGTGALKGAFERLGVGQVGVQVSDTFAWRTGAGLWVDLGPRFGMSLSLAYLAVRPEITITTGVGDRRHSVDLASIVTSVGFTYGIF
jgi:hypothetical protein